MKRTDDVFFFTLVDFLLQAFFFGLLLYAFNASKQQEEKQKQAPKDKQIATAQNLAGVSNLTELVDFLTRLQPVDRLRGWADFFSRNGGVVKAQGIIDAVDKAGGVEKVGPALHAVAQAGGVEKVTAGMERLRKFDEQFGKPPCLYDEVAGKKTARTLATVVAEDTVIRFQGSNDSLVEVLRLLGTTYPAVETLPVAEFRRVFQPLTQKRPDCRYTLRVQELTQLVTARDAVETTFYRQPMSAKNASAARPGP